MQVVQRVRQFDRDVSAAVRHIRPQTSRARSRLPIRLADDMRTILMRAPIENADDAG
jgi:hypothetical protein